MNVKSINLALIIFSAVFPFLLGISHATGIVTKTTALLIHEVEGGGSMNVKNTDNKATLLYTTIRQNTSVIIPSKSLLGEATAFTFNLKATPTLSSERDGITETANLDGNTAINFEYL